MISARSTFGPASQARVARDRANSGIAANLIDAMGECVGGLCDGPNKVKRAAAPSDFVDFPGAALGLPQAPPGARPYSLA